MSERSMQTWQLFSGSFDMKRSEVIQLIIHSPIDAFLNGSRPFLVTWFSIDAQEARSVKKYVNRVKRNTDRNLAKLACRNLLLVKLSHENTFLILRLQP
jgi:hypothetical protein